MKIFMLTGAMLGFLLGIALGLGAGSDWPSTLWHACAGALALGVLMRWWARVWLRGFHETLEQRRSTQATAGPQSSGPQLALNLPRKK